MDDRPLAVQDLNPNGAAPYVPAPPRQQQAASVLLVALHALTERAYLWVTLALVSLAWGFVLSALVYRPGVAWAPLVVAASIFTVLTHVPTWWKRSR